MEWNVLIIVMNYQFERKYKSKKVVRDNKKHQKTVICKYVKITMYL